MVNKFVALLLGIVIFAALIGATINTIFTNLSNIQNNVTAQGGAVGSMGVLFGASILGLILVVALFYYLYKIISDDSSGAR